jgi:hypothetical protein
MSRETRRDPREEGTVLEDGIEYEEVSHDDRVIGRAFRASALVLGLVLAGGGAAYWWRHRPQSVAPPQSVDAEPPRPPAHAVETPAVRFTDVASASGVSFVHQNGAEGEKLLPETMGGGAAFFDPDGDGDADILLVNGCFWPGSARSGERPTQALYANDGRGAFSDVTAAAGLALTFYGMGAACADADGDGDPDVFFTAVGPNHYLVNAGGRFEPADSGLAGPPGAWSTCAAFFDSERDGDLDLYVGNYVRWSREIDLEVGFTLSGIGRAYGPPTTFEGTQPYFYRNQGHGRFEEVGAAAGLHVTNAATGVPVGKALGVRTSDVDLDGDPDVMVANDTVANFFYRNRGDGTFEERAKESGLAFDRSGNSTGAMGIDAAWFRNDDAIAFAIGNFANEMSSFYVTRGRSDLWSDEAIGAGIGGPTRKYLSFGALFLDYDLDGRMDFLQANGHLESEINTVQPSQTYEQPSQLFWNAGEAAERTYVEVERASTGDLARPIVGRGCAYADVDGDGDPDVLLSQSGGRPLLLRNEQALGHHWLRLRLLGDGANRDAIGARVEVFLGSSKRCQEVVPFRSYLSQVEPVLTFGLGSATRVERVRIHWPDGKVQELVDLAADRLHEIPEIP